MTKHRILSGALMMVAMAAVAFAADVTGRGPRRSIRK
jgi:hypothetical protein